MKQIMIFGCGKMGYALVTSFINAGFSKSNLRVVEVDLNVRSILADQDILSAEHADVFHNFSPDVILLAVKPFLVDQIVENLKHFTSQGSAILSIIAGRPISWFLEKLGQNTPVFRAMPNTPALVGKGITAVVANKFVSKAQHALVTDIFKSCGEIVFLKDESDMDAVTAISGSGPAYIFYMTQALTQAGIAVGLEPDLALKLARSTVCGASALMDKSPDTPEQLRQNVTTPNGTTQSALDVLMNEKNGLQPLMITAVQHAQQRSKELGKV